MSNLIYNIPSLDIIDTTALDPVTRIAVLATFDSTVDTLQSINALDSNVFAAGCELIDKATGNSFKNVGTPTAVNFEPSNSGLTAAISLSSAQILALHTTPITLIPAVAGKSIVIDSYVFTMTFATSAYTGGNNVEYRYTNGTGTKVAVDTPSTVLDISSGLSAYAGIPVADVLVPSAPVVVAVPVANPAAGAGHATVTVRYHLV